MKNKFNYITNTENSVLEAPFDYGKIYQIEKLKSGERLIIGASKDQVELLTKLIEKLNPPYFVLYVLIVTRIGSELGRYQSPIIETKEELVNFLTEFKEYFETDGRHHIWIGTWDGSGTLVFDQHNVIFAYGDIKGYKEILKKEGYNKSDVNYPFPHAHLFHDSNDKFEESIFKYWEWDHYPLEESDEYDD